MAQDRTLKLTLLADTKNLSDGLNRGGKEMESFSQTIGNVAEKALKAFALIGAAVGAAALAFAKAAAEEEQAANSLARTIEATTGATKAQIDEVHRYITATSLATGITDDQLRPAFERLVRSTKNVEDATKLMNLALDLSAATGKPLEVIANALGRAYDGNTTSLGRLGLGLDANLIKSKDFNAIYETLNKTFGEFSEQRSEEAIVKFQRLQVALDEAKEAVGAALLPAFEALGDWLLTEGVPRLNAFIAGLVGDNSLVAGYSIAEQASFNFGEDVRGLIKKLNDLKGVLISVGATLAAIWAVAKIEAAVVAVIGFINLLIKAYNALKASAVVAAIASRMAINPLAGAAAGTAVLAAVGLAAKAASDSDIKPAATGLSYNQQREAQIAGSTSGLGGINVGGGGLTNFGGGGSVTGGVSGSMPKLSIAPAPTLIEQVTEEQWLKNMAPGNRDVAAFRRREEAPVNITINGAIDPASTARQIAEILNNEASITGSFTNLGVSRFATRAE